MIAIVLAASLEAEQLFATAEQEEHDLALAAALEHYDACVAADPSNRYALRAATRARWLRARSEGGFAPLERLERVRRDPKAQQDAATVDSLAHDLEAFPHGEVRTEARMFVAEAYDAQLHRSGDAERELALLLDDATGELPIRAQAATRLADLAMARGDVATAEHAAHAVAFDKQLTTRVAHWTRRRVIERVAVGAVAVFVIGALRHARAVLNLRSFAPRAFAVCGYLALVAGVLANAYERGNALPFMLVPACVFPVALLARAWALEGKKTLAARIARATLGAAAVVALGFLVLDGVDVRYLESFGL
jgi:hypothetical protein